jgi:hypothetical protein
MTPNAANQPREIRASADFASLCSLFPLFRMTATVHHRNDNDGSFFDSIENAKREATNHCPARFPV